MSFWSGLTKRTSCRSFWHSFSCCFCCTRRDNCVSMSVSDVMTAGCGAFVDSIFLSQWACTALKAAGLLSCLQLKITSFGKKLKWMWHLREVQLEILGAVLSLLSWTMLLREESACQLHSLLWLCLQRQHRGKAKVMFWMWRSKDIAGMLHAPASADDGSLLFWASFFAAANDRASSMTSPAR